MTDQTTPGVEDLSPLASLHVEAESVREPAGLVLNEPSPEGRELGEQLARFVEIERERDPTLREPCFDCAFRKGAAPNGMAATVMDALKCVIEKTPFYCHLTYDDGKERLCAGWEALVDGKSPAGTAPWPMIGGYTDPSVIQMGHAPALDTPHD